MDPESGSVCNEDDYDATDVCHRRMSHSTPPLSRDYRGHILVRAEVIGPEREKGA